MAYEQKDNSGIMFVNDRKTESKHPDRTGNCMIEGREFWVSGWVKQGAKGPFLTLSFKPKDGQERRIPGSAKTPINIDDEIPF